MNDNTQPAAEDALRAAMPKNFWNTIERRLRQIVRNVPDVYAGLTDSERETQDKQVESFMQQLEADLRGQIDRIARDYLAEGHPRMKAGIASVAIEKGAVKVKLSVAQDLVPDELYTHNGPCVVVLVEDQLDWVSRLTRVDEAEAAAAQADLALGAPAAADPAGDAEQDEAA